MRAFGFLSSVLVVLAAVGCGGSVSDDRAQGSGGTGGSGAQSGGTSALGGGDAGSSKARPCGAGFGTCAPDEYCDFGGTNCGTQGEVGSCQPRPKCGVCDCSGFSVCGCDGKPYETACEAHQAGFDVSSSNACLPGSNTCDAEATALSAKLSGMSCTTALRLDPESQYAIVGYAIFCGPYSMPDETTARATAYADTGFGTQCGGEVIHATPPEPLDEIVILHPTDGFAACACCGDGWVAAVSAMSGLSVFGASLPVVPPAQITFPKSWLSPSDLGSGCVNSSPIPPARGYDLSASFSMPGSPLDSVTISSALASVFKSALPRAILQAGHSLTNAVVLKYIVTSGEDLMKSDVIVLLNSGMPPD